MQFLRLSVALGSAVVTHGGERDVAGPALLQAPVGRGGLAGAGAVAAGARGPGLVERARAGVRGELRGHGAALVRAEQAAGPQGARESVADHRQHLGQTETGR